jgi:hypothetical protein
MVYIEYYNNKKRSENFAKSLLVVTLPKLCVFTRVDNNYILWITGKWLASARWLKLSSNVLWFVDGTYLWPQALFLFILLLVIFLSQRALLVTLSPH